MYTSFHLRPHLFCTSSQHNLPNSSVYNLSAYISRQHIPALNVPHIVLMYFSLTCTSYSISSAQHVPHFTTVSTNISFNTPHSNIISLHVLAHAVLLPCVNIFLVSVSQYVPHFNIYLISADMFSERISDPSLMV